MSPFNWTLGHTRFFLVAWSESQRHDMEEFYGWWRHIAYGFYVYRRKSTPNWSGGAR